MRANRFRPRNTALAVAFAMLPAGTVLAQTLPEEIPEDYYRAELVILERLVDPAEIQEQMANNPVEPPVATETDLWVEGKNESRSTDLELVDNSELHLEQAVQRLKRSGRYRILAEAGWYQAFPPDYDSGPMRVTMGDWLEAADQREIEGHIRIERRRYLHVGAHLNHWQIDEATLEEAREAAQAEAATTSETPEDNARESGNSQAGQATESAPMPVSLEPVAPELLTWIRETRRMRSGEIHFIDSPTIGVLVYFEPIEQE